MIGNISEKIVLGDGSAMPGYGYGVYKASGREVVTGMACALACGYRYVDTASFYDNETEVGQAIKNCQLRRDELFIVSKIWPTEFRKPVAALDASLRRLGLERLDGYLLHWPGLDGPARLKVFETLLEERRKGKIGALGVSNFTASHLTELHDNFGIWPAINQIEVHPRYQQRELCAFCADKGIQVVAWSPLGRGGGLAIPEVKDLSRAKGKTPAQIILRWHVQNGLVPIPKSVHDSRIRENSEVFDFALDEEQMRLMNGLELPDNAGRTGRDPLRWPPMS